MGGGARTLNPLRRRGLSLAASFAWILSCSAHAAAEIRIVVAGDTSGPRTVETSGIVASVRAAVDAINAHGEVLGEAVSVSIADDGCDSAAATATARKIAAEKPALVIGHGCSNAAIAAAREYGPARVLFIATGARHRDLTEKRAGPTIFRLSGRDDIQGGFTGSWFAANYRSKRIALVSDRTAYARRLTEDIRKAVLASGGPAPTLATIVAGDKDFSPLIAQLKAVAPDVVYFAGFPIEAGVVLRQLRAAGINAGFVAADAVAADEFVALSGKTIDGVNLVVPNGSSAQAVAARAGAAIEIWHAAVMAAGTTAADAVAKQLQLNASETKAMGLFRFSAKGDAELPSFQVLTCHAGTEPSILAACGDPTERAPSADR